MPTPFPYESENHFIQRCIPQVIADGTTNDERQAYAICQSIYERESEKNGNNENESDQNT